jgi:galactose mutarotase-like enzyme
MMTPDARTLRQGDTEVIVLPDRGALVASLEVRGRSVLYLDPTTVESPIGAIRGGIPLLFPFAGELTDGRLLATGTELSRHGFARRKPWTVTALTSESVSMALVPDADARAQFPIEWEATYVVTARSRGVSIALDVRNTDSRDLPLAPGWHPYFPCPADRKLDCLRQVLPANLVPSTEPITCDVNIQAPAERRVDVALPSIGTVRLTFSENLRTLEVWTPPDRELICVEPWVGPSNTINTSDSLRLAPGGTARFSMAVELDA